MISCQEQEAASGSRGRGGGSQTQTGWTAVSSQQEVEGTGVLKACFEMQEPALQVPETENKEIFPFLCHKGLWHSC